LEAVASAAAADPGTYPKTVIFLSSGFVVGRGSGRTGLGSQMDGIVSLAKRNGIRIYTVDAAGLKTMAPVSVENRAGRILVGNPHLLTLLSDHVVGWAREKESSLNQLAAETGGRFLLSSNDLAGLAGIAVRATGELYYLGYLSRQPPDGRFHRLRVTTAASSARVHARAGFFARDLAVPETVAATGPVGEDWATVVARARDAARSGDMKELASSLELLVRRFPNQTELWHDLGITHLKLDNPRRAAEVLQKAFALAPGDKAVGLLLARALIAARYRRAAADILLLMTRRHPQDIGIMLELGRAYEADSRTEEAFATYRRALDLAADPSLEHYRLLIRTAAPLGRRVEAASFIREFLERGGAEEQVRQWSQPPVRRSSPGKP
jgi:tetratricopeptide (TPR) repeat protein